jgi:hypothetical protein
MGCKGRTRSDSTAFAASGAICSETAEWTQSLHALLAAAGKSIKAVINDPAHARWKVSIAATLRQAGVPYHWIREVLHMGPANKIRAQVFRFNERRTP